MEDPDRFEDISRAEELALTAAEAGAFNVGAGVVVVRPIAVICP